MHVPSTMGSTNSSNIGLIVIAVTPSIVAAASATTNLSGFEDRDRTVTVGKSVKNILFDITVRAPAATGDLQCIVWKLERQLAVPTLGVANVPTSAQMSSEGTQQAWRLRNPGRVLNYTHIVFSPETTRNRRISVNFAKFRMAKVRPGDFYGICIFNRSSGSVTFDIEMRYKSQD